MYQCQALAERAPERSARASPPYRPPNTLMPISAARGAAPWDAAPATGCLPHDAVHLRRARLTAIRRVGTRRAGRRPLHRDNCTGHERSEPTHCSHHAPASITAPLGEPVTSVVTNAGGGRHDLVVKLEFRGIQQRSFATNLLPGETREATFTFGASVDWETECPVGKHRALGMQGTIHVPEWTIPNPTPTAQPTPSPPAATVTPAPTIVPTVVPSPSPAAGPATMPTPLSTRQPTSPGRATLGAAARRQLRESRSPRSGSPGRRPAELAPRSALWRALRHDVRVTRNSCSLDASLVPVRPTQRARPRSHSESGHGPESGTHRVPSQRHTVEE